MTVTTGPISLSEKRMRELVYFLVYRIPVPKLGGTFVYCENESVKRDSLGRRTRYKTTCTRRFRSERKYRQHFRRAHSDT